MKKTAATSLFYLALLPLLLVQHLQSTPELVDCIAATVGLGTEKLVITTSEVAKPALFAHLERVPLQAHIDHCLQLIEAKSVKFGAHSLEPSASMVNAKLELVKNMLGLGGLDDNATQRKLQEVGLTMNELKEQVQNYCTVSQLWGLTFSDRPVVPLSAIEAYHRAHPEEIPAQVHLLVAEIEAIELDRLLRQHREATSDNINYEALAKELDFFDLDTLPIEQLDAVNRKLIEGAKDGQLCLPTPSQTQLKSNEKMQVLRVVKTIPRHFKKLEERKAEIAKIIELDESQKRYQEYLQEMLCKSHVRQFLKS